MRINHRRSRRSQPTPRSSSRDGRRTTWRPSLLLWRHRHLVVAVCLGTAVLVALSILRPGPAQGRQVLVAARPISAGTLIAEQDVTTSRLPTSALPQAGLTSQEQVIGTRAAIALEPGTVLTTSMTSGNMTQQLGADERLVQVPVDVGAELARPGARVDVIIGAAFKPIVDAITKVIMTIIGQLIGQPNFDSLGAFSLYQNGSYTFHLATAQELAANPDGFVMPGTIVTTVINFFLIAVAVYFAIVLPMNKVKERLAKQKAEEEAKEVTDVELLTEIRDLLSANAAKQ